MYDHRIFLTPVSKISTTYFRGVISKKEPFKPDRILSAIWRVGYVQNSKQLTKWPRQLGADTKKHRL